MSKGAIELDTCNNVQLRGPVNIMHDPTSALPFTQGIITAVDSNYRRKVFTWTVQACGRITMPSRNKSASDANPCTVHFSTGCTSLRHEVRVLTSEPGYICRCLCTEARACLAALLTELCAASADGVCLFWLRTSA